MWLIVPSERHDRFAAGVVFVIVSLGIGDLFRVRVWTPQADSLGGGLAACILLTLLTAVLLWAVWTQAVLSWRTIWKDFFRAWFVLVLLVGSLVGAVRLITGEAVIATSPSGISFPATVQSVGLGLAALATALGMCIPRFGHHHGMDLRIVRSNRDLASRLLRALVDGCPSLSRGGISRQEPLSEEQLGTLKGSLAFLRDLTEEKIALLPYETDREALRNWAKSAAALHSQLVNRAPRDLCTRQVCSAAEAVLFDFHPNRGGNR